MKIPTTFRPFATWTTKTLAEEIAFLESWTKAVPVCITKAQLKKHRDLERMKHEMKRRTNA